MNGNNQGRRNWTLSLTVAFLLAAAAAAVGTLAESPEHGTDRLHLRSSAGSVLFDHGKHNSTVDSCTACHHDLLGAAQETSCAECHGDDVDKEDFEHADLKEFHGRQCLNCHAQVKENDQAVSCRTCHPGVQNSEDMEVSCNECHDDYTPDMMEHDELTEIEDHTCLGCHKPDTVSNVYHVNCSGCHLEMAPRRFADAAGAVACGACHLR